MNPREKVGLSLFQLSGRPLQNNPSNMEFFELIDSAKPHNFLAQFYRQ